MGKEICFKNCFDCNKPYKISGQRWCYDRKIDYLMKNPLIVKKQQKKNPYSKKNEIAYSFEVGGFTACNYYSMEGEPLECNITSVFDDIFRHVVESIMEGMAIKC